jgi:hypothetical protein
MTESASNLLRDLALLLHRYPAEDFEELARLFGRATFARSLTRLLEELAATRANAKQVKRSHGRSALFESIRQENAEKYLLLRGAEESLLNQEVHATTRDAIRAVESSGIVIPKKSYKSRREVFLAFLRAARDLSVEDVQRVVAALGVTRTAGDLQRWTDIIVPNRDVPKGR